LTRLDICRINIFVIARLDRDSAVFNTVTFITCAPLHNASPAIHSGFGTQKYRTPFSTENGYTDDEIDIGHLFNHISASVDGRENFLGSSKHISMFMNLCTTCTIFGTTIRHIQSSI